MFKEKADAIWSSLVDAALEHCDHSERRLSRLTQHSKGWANSLKRRKKGAYLEECLGLAAATGKPDWLAWGSFFPQPESPAELLRALRPTVLEAPDRPSNLPLLVQQLEEAWECLGPKRGISAAASRTSLRYRLSWIDDLRLRDLPESLRLLEREIGMLLADLDFVAAPDPGLLCDLAFASSIWADIQRSARNLEVAFRVCPLALDFATRSDDKWTLAQCLWKGALLLHEVGHDAFGLPWIEKAGFLFGLDGHTPHLAELLVTRGMLEWNLGKSEVAFGSLREALSRLALSNQRWRIPAYENLTTIAHLQGNFADARKFVDALAAEHREQDAFQGLIQWRRAAILLQSGDLERGREAYRATLQLLIRNGQAENAAYAVFDLAELCLGQGDPAKAARIAADAMPFACEMANNNAVAELIENFFALTRLGELQQADIDQGRQELARLGYAEPQRLSR